MNRIVKSSVACLLAAAVAGCASVTVEAPAGKAVALASAGKPTPKIVDVKRWYMFWGMMPLGDSTISQDIAEAGFKSARVKVYMGLDDFLISATVGLIPFVPVSRSIEIQGE